MNVNHALNRSIQEFCQVYLAEAECIRVADLGCASGPNTLLAVESIIDSINRECHNLNILKLPNIQVFLNDLMSNDFNSIFKLLPEFYEELEKSNGRGSGSCFIAAMPGSFYGRLFLDNSLHFIHSSNSLHWLSQVRQSPALLLLTRIAMLVFTDPHYLNFHYYLSKPLTA